MSNIWIDINTSIPKESAWVLAAINPINYHELDDKDINEWRRKYGCTKVWFHDKRWWEPDPHGSRTTEVTDRITHWTELLKVPIIMRKENEEI